MKNHIEKIVRRYVIASVAEDGRTLYLRKIPARPEYGFVFDIENATKTLGRSIAQTVLEGYYRDIPDSKMELVVIPLEIKYELINESGI